MTSKTELTPAFNKLHNEYRLAKARFDVGIYTAAMEGKDMPEDEELVLSREHCRATDALLLHPAVTVHELYRKLEVFNDEGIFDGSQNARALAAILESDAHRLAFELN